MPRYTDVDKLLKDERQHYDYLSDEYYIRVRDVEFAPTIEFTEDVAPIIKAHWETIDGELHCSNCKAILEEYMSKWVNFKYCYHCGARMEKE